MIPIRMIVTNALGASESLLRRIEDLLNIAKMEDGQFGYKFEETDVSDFIAKVLADILPAAQKAGIKIYFDRPAQSLAPCDHRPASPLARAHKSSRKFHPVQRGEWRSDGQGG